VLAGCTDKVVHFRLRTSSTLPCRHRLRAHRQARFPRELFHHPLAHVSHHKFSGTQWPCDGPPKSTYKGTLATGTVLVVHARADVHGEARPFGLRNETFIGYECPGTRLESVHERESRVAASESGNVNEKISVQRTIAPLQRER